MVVSAVLIFPLNVTNAALIPTAITPTRIAYSNADTARVERTNFAVLASSFFIMTSSGRRVGNGVTRPSHTVGDRRATQAVSMLGDRQKGEKNQEIILLFGYSLYQISTIAARNSTIITIPTDPLRSSTCTARATQVPESRAAADEPSTVAARCLRTAPHGTLRDMFRDAVPRRTARALTRRYRGARPPRRGWCEAPLRLERAPSTGAKAATAPGGGRVHPSRQAP